MRWHYAILTALLLPAVGCEHQTCQEASANNYNDDDQSCARLPSSPDNADAAEAKAACIDDCQDALYRPGGAEESNSTALANEGDAIEFVDCVLALPLDECDEVVLHCPWITW